MKYIILYYYNYISISINGRDSLAQLYDICVYVELIQRINQAGSQCMWPFHLSLTRIVAYQRHRR